MIVTAAMVIKHLFTKSKTLAVRNDKIEKKVTRNEQNPIRELLEGAFIAIGASMLKDIIAEVVSKPNQPLVEVKHQQHL